jgi:hypothetical protein
MICLNYMHLPDSKSFQNFITIKNLHDSDFPMYHKFKISNYHLLIHPSYASSYSPVSMYSNY